jgi:Glycosyltransferase family 87
VVPHLRRRGLPTGLSSTATVPQLAPDGWPSVYVRHAGASPHHRLFAGRTRRIWMAGAAIASMSSAALFIAPEHPNVFGDAAWYAQATPALLGRRDLYPPQWLGPHEAAWPQGFNLPPATALFGPIASLSPALWGVIMALCVVGGLAVLWPRLPDPADFYLVCALVAFWPLWSVLIWSNVNALVFLLLAIGFRWSRHSGWTLGAAAAIKASPILLLAVLIGRRDWRQLRLAVATATALTLSVAALTGPRTVTDFVRVQLHESHPPLDYGWSAADFMPEAAVVILAATLAGVAVLRRGSWSWALAGTLVLIPTLWLHYWTWALVPALGWLQARSAGRESQVEAARSVSGTASSRHRDGVVSAGDLPPDGRVGDAVRLQGAELAEHVLEPGGGVDAQERSAVLVSGDHVGGPSRHQQVVALAEGELLLPALEVEGAVEHVEGLLHPVMDVRHRPAACAPGELQDRQGAVGGRAVGEHPHLNHPQVSDLSLASADNM